MEPPLNYVTYSDATYDYFCEAPMNTPLSDKAWRIYRKNKTTGQGIYAGNGDKDGYNQPATNLATVAALTYTLGA